MGLRRCKICGKVAHDESELALFKYEKKSAYQHENLCLECRKRNRIGQPRGPRNKIKMKEDNDKWNPIHNPKRINFKGKQIYLKDIQRKNVCSICGKTSDEQNNVQMCLHHIIYDEENPQANTIELCSECHGKIHGGKKAI